MEKSLRNYYKFLLQFGVFTNLTLSLETNLVIRNVGFTQNVLLDCQDCERNVTKWMYNDVLIFVDTVAVERQFEDSIYLLKNYSLLITPLFSSHEGVYTCLCGKEAVKQYDLVTEVTPTLTIAVQGLYKSAPEVYLDACKKYTIVCHAHYARPAVKLSWSVNNRKINESKISFVASIQTVKMNTTTFDSLSHLKMEFPFVNGTITCTSTAQSTFREIDVDLGFRTFDLPEVSLAINNIRELVYAYIPAHKKSVFACQALNSRPEANLRWMINNTPLDESVQINNVNITTKSNVKDRTTVDTLSTFKFYPTDENGTVSCVVDHNASGTTEAVGITWLSYVVPVMFLTINGQSNATEVIVRDQEYVHVTCHAFGARPVFPRLTWLINNKTTDAADYNSSLTSISYVNPNKFDVETTLRFKPTGKQGSVTCISRGIANVTDFVSAVYYTRENNERTSASNLIMYVGSIAAVCVLLMTGIVLIRIFGRSFADLQASSQARNQNSDPTNTTSMSSKIVQKKFANNLHSVSPASIHHPEESETSDNSGYCPIAEVEYEVYAEPTKCEYEKRMFQGKDMCLIMNMKLGQIYNRWMGTLTQSTGTSKCVVFSTLNDHMLRSRNIQWDKYVKRMLDVPKCKSLLDIVGICIDDTHLYLVHEYVVCETLETRIEARRDGGSYYVTSLWQSEVKSHLMNLLEGMEIIHSYGLLHPGLTAGKILVTNQGICKLYDFCLPQDATSKLMISKSQGKHFVRQLPPESLLRNEYLQESDVWSFATVVWNLVSKESVEAIEDNEMISMEESIASLSEKWPAEFCHLRNPNLFRCWMFNSSLRPSMNSLRKSFMEILSFKTTSSLSETSSDSQSDLYLPMKGPINSKVIETDF